MKRKKVAEIGIDPGLNGAVAVISGNEIVVADLPVVEKPYGKGNMISPQLLSNLFKDLTERFTIQKATIEAVAAMSGQGVNSVFSFGRTCGVIEGVVSSFGIPIEYVAPQRWKKHFGLIKKDKDMARGLAISKYPAYADLFKRKKDVDRAEALLICEYGGLI